MKSVIECGVYDDDFNLHPVEWTTVAESIERQRQMKPGFGPRYPTDWEATTGYYDVGAPRIAFCGNDIWCVPTGTRGDEFDLELEVYTFQQDWISTSDSVLVQQVANPAAANGSYWPYGIYNRRPLYINILYGPPVAPMHMIWWDGVGKWRIAPMADLGQPVLVNYAEMVATTMVPGGAYVPHGTWTATAEGVIVVEMMPGSDTSDIWLTKGAQYLMWAGIVEINHLAKEFVFRQEGNLPPPEKLAETALEDIFAVGHVSSMNRVGGMFIEMMKKLWPTLGVVAMTSCARTDIYYPSDGKSVVDDERGRAHRAHNGSSFKWQRQFGKYGD